jgi:glycosyltransferase involved in cell wall biosynthesis
MEIGGSQLNAIQLAGAVRDLGHEVIVVSEPGPLVARLQGLELEHVEIPSSVRHPSPAVLSLLSGIAQRRHVDLIHGYEWPPIVEACFGPRLLHRIPVVGTVLSASVVPFFPRTVPLVVGTQQLRGAVIASGYRRVTTIEPPVDTDSDHPSAAGQEFREKLRVEPDEALIVIACRLVPELKLEGLLAACDSAADLARAGHRVRLAIVGDGRARHQVAARSKEANAGAGREVVSLTGELHDPRPAYAAADIIVGQGGSALRGMAFGKPLVVVGERGFSELMTPDSAPWFLEQGLYGIGSGSLGPGVPGLRRALEILVSSPHYRRELGAFARDLVVERFGLRRAAMLLEEEYRAATAGPATRGVGVDLARCGAGVIRTKIRRKYERWRGTLAVDDANAVPVVAPSQVG